MTKIYRDCDDLWCQCLVFAVAAKLSRNRTSLISDFFVLQGPRAASVGHRPEYVAAFDVAMAHGKSCDESEKFCCNVAFGAYYLRPTKSNLHQTFFSRFWQLWVYWYNITYSTHQYTYAYMLFIYQRFYAILRQILTITQTKARGLAYCSAGKHSRWLPAPTKRRRLTSCPGLLFWEAGRTCLVMALMLNWKRRPIMTVWCKLWLPLCTARKDWKSMRNWYNTIPCYWLHTIAIYYNILYFLFL
jgi:hypothetical protein